MARSLAILISLLFLGPNHLQAAPVAVVTSRSGQFSVFSTVLRGESGSLVRVPVAGEWGLAIIPNPSPEDGNGEAPVRLEPALIATSCERIKEGILRELNVPDRWVSRIDLRIHTTVSSNVPPCLNIFRGHDKWTYAVDLPVAMTPRRLANTLVEVILLEMANRSATFDSASIPPWLAEGMAAQIQATDPTVLLQPSRRTDSIRSFTEQVKPLLLLAPEQLSHDAALIAKFQRVHSHPVLTFEELSWPPSNLAADPAREEIFQASAQLFLYRLLNQEDGRANVCQFIEMLPRHLNWQLSFMECYEEQFQHLHDVEKWWGLASFQPGETAIGRWTAARSGELLRDILLVPVQEAQPKSGVKTGTASLQDIILRWNPQSQTAPLRRTLMELTSIRSRLDPSYLPLVDHYCMALRDYLKKHDAKKHFWQRSKDITQGARKAAAQQLARLDARLESMTAPSDKAAAPKAQQAAAKKP